MGIFGNNPKDCIQPPLYVDAQRGCDDKSGKNWENAFKTISHALKKVQKAGTIYLYGKFVEDGLTTPHGVTDVTIVGAGTQPREGNAGRSMGPKNGATDWRWKNDEGTEPLLHVTQQGWAFKNLMLRGSDLGGCIKLTRTLLAETSDEGLAGDHAGFYGCAFQGGAFGIGESGGIVGVKIQSCMFRLFTKGTAITSLLGEGVGFPIFWDIRDNRFVANNADIKIGLVNGIVMDNVFQRKSIMAPDINPALSIDLSGGYNNTVERNWLS